MKSFFSKKSKSHASADDEEGSEPSSPVKQSQPSPIKSSSPTKAKAPRPASPSQRESFSATPSKPRTSGSSRRKKIDPDIHPLNLPPEQRKRYSTLSSMSNKNSMDIDREPANGSPSSPPPAHSSPQPQPPMTRSHLQHPQSQSQTQNNQQAPTPSFSIPVPNGSASPTKMDEDVPVPPPHRSQPSSPVPTPEAEAEAYKLAGNKFFKEKEFRRAIDEYTKAVNLQPLSPTYLSNRAAAYMSAADYKAALEDCKRAADLDPQNHKILLRLARIYTSLGLPEEALTTFGRLHPPPSAKDMAPAKEMLQHVKAAQRALQDGTAASMVSHALDMAERLIGVGALKPRAWQLMRGEAYLKMGDANSLGEAASIAMSLLRQNNKDPEALVLRGRVLYTQGNHAEALNHFRRALDLDPDFRGAVKWLRTVQKLDRMKEDGNKEYKAGKWADAVAKYSEALEIDPANRGTNAKILQNRALCRVQLKEFEEAMADCDRALALDPEYTKARKTRANALGQAGRYEEAVQEWKALSEKEPEDRTILKELRRAELELKKSQRKDYYKILEISKDADDKEIKKAYRKLAVVHHPDKNPGDEQAEARFKDIAEAYEHLIDPQKRARYDSGDDLVDMSDMFGGGGGGMAGGIDPEILFSMMGGMGGQGGPGGGGFHFPNAGGSRQPRGFPSNFQFS